MGDIVTYLICGVRPSTKVTAKITAPSAVGKSATLRTITHTAAGDIDTPVTNTDGEWNVSLDELDCILELTADIDLDLSGVQVAFAGTGSATFVTAKGGVEAKWEATVATTFADSKDPWPPPGAATEVSSKVDTVWLTPTLAARPVPLPRDE